jgi:HSP20 family protein
MALTPRLLDTMTPRRNVGGLIPERDAFETIQELMRRPFEDFFGNERFMPRLDVSEQGDESIIRAEIPGMNPEDVDIRLEGGNLVFSGEKKHEDESRDENRYHVERSYGRFQRTIPVSGELKEDDVKASFKNGVLTVRLPKNKVEGHTKKIPVEIE